MPTTRYKIAAFIIGAALAGAAGGFFSHHMSLVSPESFRFLSSSYTGSITIVAMVILGGQGSITGAVIGATLLTLVPEILRSSTGWLAEAFHHLGAKGSWASGFAQFLDQTGTTISHIEIDKWRLVIYPILIILLMLFRPQGIFGRSEINDLIRGALRCGKMSLGAMPNGGGGRA